FYLNLLPALAGRPQLESFSRGYHDTLSLYYLEYFDFSEAAFRLYNIGAVLVLGDRSALLPESFRETWSGTDLAIFETDAAVGYCASGGTPVTLVRHPKAARPLLRRISLPLFDVGVLPRLARDEPAGPWFRWLGGNRIQYVAPGDGRSREETVDELLRELKGSPRNVPGPSPILDERGAPDAYTP